MPNILSARHISRKIGDRVILNDVNLEITDGSSGSGHIVSLMGPYGIGKTTLFRVLAGLERPDTGEVRIGPNTEMVIAGMVGVVGQHCPLFEHRTVLVNLLLAARAAGYDSGPAAYAAADYLDRFRLLEQANLYPRQLSGGQRQRVAIARQFLCSEHLILMDEPFSSLDPVAIEEVIALIHEAAAPPEKHTVVIVTHDPHAALQVSERVCLMGRRSDTSDTSDTPGASILYSIDVCGDKVALATELMRLFRTL